MENISINKKTKAINWFLKKWDKNKYRLFFVFVMVILTAAQNEYDLQSIVSNWIGL